MGTVKRKNGSASSFSFSLPVSLFVQVPFYLLVVTWGPALSLDLLRSLGFNLGRVVIKCHQESIGEGGPEVGTP